MPEVSLIFDEFGHKYQPYWLNWYELLMKEDSLDVVVLANRISNTNKKNIKLIKAKKAKDKIINIAHYLIHGKLPSKSQVIFKNVLEIKSPIIHILKVQMYPGLSPYISSKSKLVFSFRGYDTLVNPHTDPIWRAQLLSIFKKAHGLHFVSDFIRQEAIALGADPEKCKTIYRSVDTDFFSPSPKNLKRRTIKLLSVARLTWEKGYIYTLEALSIIKNRGYNFHYTIVGDGPDLNLVSFHINRFNLNAHITILKHQNRDELKSLYQDADIFLITSVTDALPNVVLEASAMEVPIVGTNVAGIPECVVNHISGLLVPPYEPDEIANAIEFMINNPEARYKMGKAGRLFVSERFNPITTTKQWVEFYNIT